MKLYSTRNKNLVVDLKQAVLNSLPADNGLYMPEVIPKLPKSFFKDLPHISLQDIAYTVALNIIGDSIPKKDLRNIVTKSMTFPAPVYSLSESTGILELWHGPTLAFKDFGARFMANMMAYFNKEEDQELTILVATSGDTGGAVASGFYNTPGVKVKILYPSGKVSYLQEKQLTTLGQNIEAFEVEGTFDDCQTLVKKAFLDIDINKKLRLSSANSINIARLIPQSFYYFDAWRQALVTTDKDIVFIVPSGNYGNLTAGLFAQRMGLPIHKFIAATNINDIIPEYLLTGQYKPQSSIATISNAMDVGAPSNYQRMSALFNNNLDAFRNTILGFASNDDDTRMTMQDVYSTYNYILDPHTAVAYNAWNQLKLNNEYGIVISTAHPSKFKAEVESTLNITIEIPERLAILAERQKSAKKLRNNFEDFKSMLMNQY